ncbi:MAG TPA: 4Fe-4S ferredoxin, partial [Clostridium sp.]|nr:4Fe-4S ferredoxin [Clostridium sp.]
MINIQNENYIRRKFTKFIENDPRNVLHDYNNMKIYDAPLIGIA